ncbi:MAG: alpha/beta fold hydrolase [Candidatus Peribacteraceae bacterium]|jgi:hypothetical protein
MATVFIFHGIQGHPEENWFPWLKKKLEAEGHQVIVPAFPHADHPTLQEWLDHFAQYTQHIAEDSVIIGHSFGAAFALQILQNLPHPVRASFFIAAVYDVMDNEFDNRMTTFVENGFAWETIRKRSGHAHVIHSDNDPYIALAKAQHLAEILRAPLTLIKGGGHFNTMAGYSTFDALFQSVREELSE